MGLKVWVSKTTGMPSIWTDWRGMVYRNGIPWWEPETHQLNLPLTLPLTPLGESVTYRQGGASFTITRPSPAGGGHMLSSLDGRTIATFRWIGEDQTDLGVEVFTANTSGGLVSRWPLRPPERTFTLDCLTDPEQTRTMEELIAARTPLLLHHDRNLCQMDPCDIDPIRAVVVTKAAHARTRRSPAAQRRWSLTCSTRDLDALTGGTVELAPALTWGDWEKLDGQWKRRTYTELCQLIMGMP